MFPFKPRQALESVWSVRADPRFVPDRIRRCTYAREPTHTYTVSWVQRVGGWMGGWVRDRRGGGEGERERVCVCEWVGGWVGW